MSFAGKVVLVTGAASGIGAATVELFAKEDAAVAMVDMDGESLQAPAQQNARDGRNTLAITANVANDDDAKRIIQETIDKFGKLDVLINCAGVLRFGSILDGNLMQSYDDLININLRAVMQMTCLAAPHLIKTKGNIVNISSLAALHTPMIEFIAYSVSKVGVKHFTSGSALELASHGVRVNSVCPGPVRTNIMSNSGRKIVRPTEPTVYAKISEPQEIAELVLYLASDKAKGITGSDFLMDNGSLLKM